MPTTDENRFFTPIIEWEVAPEQQQALIDGVADEVERHFKQYAGFISASFHASEDGRRVINYGQWHSKEDWSRARASGNDESTAVIAEVVRRGTPDQEGAEIRCREKVIDASQCPLSQRQ